MNLFTLLAACSIGVQAPNLPPTEAECVNARVVYAEALKSLRLSQADVDAITRVTIAEAGNQGTSGEAAVILVVLNRLISGQFGATASEVINQSGQFEPVMRAGGWQRLPLPTAEQKASVKTVLALTLDGRLPDLTNGALYFQNRTIVAAREKSGTVSAGLTDFGGAPRAATIKDHSFYAEFRRQKTAKAAPKALPRESRSVPYGSSINFNQTGAAIAADDTGLFFNLPDIENDQRTDD